MHAAVLLVPLLLTGAAATLSFNPIYASSMVLRADAPVSIHGWETAAGAEITVTFNGIKVSSQVPIRLTTSAN